VPRIAKPITTKNILVISNKNQFILDIMINLFQITRELIILIHELFEKLNINQIQSKNISSIN
jgi:predicted HTH domain antitoxin